MDYPSVYVKKKGKTFGLCIDLRGLNKIIIRNKCPSIRMDDLLDQM